MNEKDVQQLAIKDAQYRKGLSIAFFNATNNAVSLLQAMGVFHPGIKAEVIKGLITEWRDWMMTEHAEYHARVIANVGVHFDTKTTLTRLQDAKNKVELKIVWLSLSEDERQNEEIKKLAYSLREQFIKAETETQKDENI